MARVDDYQKSYDLAAARLAQEPADELALLCGAELRDGALHFLYMGRPVRVSLDPIAVEAQDSGPELPLAEQALVLHYLVKADGTRPLNQWITFREVESGEFYWSAFVSRAKAPLQSFFGARPKLLADLGPKVGGRLVEGPADVNLLVPAFPLVPITYQLWAGDEEFGAEANILFDRSVGHFLVTEDVALTASLPVYKMMALARLQG